MYAVYSVSIIQILIKLSKPLFPYLRKTPFVFIQTETNLLVFDTSLSFTANVDAIRTFSSELSKVIRIYIHSWKWLRMHGKTSVCQALSVGGLINETDHYFSVFKESVF